ncbi:MAG TPA: TRAP transporter substrate-binding protein DctP, partial [Paenibacillaceae bacterium]
ALERGTIDGVHTGVSSIVERKLYEVLTDMTGGPNFRITFLTQILAASPKFWNELPDDTRAAILEAAKVANEFGRKDAEQNDAEYTKKVQELGIKLTEVTAEEGQRFKEKVKPVYDNYLAAAGEIGQKILDAIEAAKN